MRLEALLARADVEPSGLSPSAVLCVRRLDDPRPRVLRLDAREIRPPPAWEQAVAGRLADALRSAVRPAVGFVPAAADAVLFADRAELLACLARDVAAGTMAAHWWWRGLDVEPMSSSAVATAFEREPRAVPRAFALLTEWGWTVPVVHALDFVEAARLVSAVGTSFALPAVRRAASLVGKGAKGSAGSARVILPLQRERAAAPWHGAVPEAEAFHDVPASALLVGIALAIERAPVAVRSMAFAEALDAWILDTRRDGAHRWAPSALGRAMHAGHRSEGSSPPRPGRRRTDRSATQAGIRSTIPFRPETSVSAKRPATRRDDPRLDPKAVGAAAMDEPLRPVDVAARPADAMIAPSVAGELTETRLGGAFYLLNVAIHLGLYGDFTQPDEPGIELDPWEFVTLLATALGAPSHPAATDEPAASPAVDPLWRLLARLAGRDHHTRPGIGFRPDPDWRMAPAWLEPFGSAARSPWSWSSAGGRLRVQHPEGFAVIDIACDAPSVRRSARRAVRPYGRGIRLRRASLPPQRGRRPVDRWVARLAVYARVRLARALACQPADVARVLLRHDARVVVTPESVDVEFSLDDLPIAVRVAGLDRDPGWVPAARRTVTFHFR